MTKRFLALAFLLCFALPSYPQSYTNTMTMREWARDLEQLQVQVLDPLGETFAGETCQDSFDPYFEALLNQVRELKTTISSITYLLFRETVLSTAQDLVLLENKLSCDRFDKWSILRAHIENKLDYTGDVFALLDVAGTL